MNNLKVIDRICDLSNFQKMDKEQNKRDKEVLESQKICAYIRKSTLDECSEYAEFSTKIPKYVIVRKWPNGVVSKLPMLSFLYGLGIEEIFGNTSDRRCKKHNHNHIKLEVIFDSVLERMVIPSDGDVMDFVFDPAVINTTAAFRLALQEEMF